MNIELFYCLVVALSLSVPLFTTAKATPLLRARDATVKHDEGCHFEVAQNWTVHGNSYKLRSMDSHVPFSDVFFPAFYGSGLRLEIANTHFSWFGFTLRIFAQPAGHSTVKADCECRLFDREGAHLLTGRREMTGESRFHRFSFDNLEPAEDLAIADRKSVHEVRCVINGTLRLSINNVLDREHRVFRQCVNLDKTTFTEMKPTNYFDVQRVGNGSANYYLEIFSPVHDFFNETERHLAPVFSTVVKGNHIKLVHNNKRNPNPDDEMLKKLNMEYRVDIVSEMINNTTRGVSVVLALTHQPINVYNLKGTALCGFIKRDGNIYQEEYQIENTFNAMNSRILYNSASFMEWYRLRMYGSLKISEGSFLPIIYCRVQGEMQFRIISFSKTFY